MIDHQQTQDMTSSDSLVVMKTIPRIETHVKEGRSRACNIGEFLSYYCLLFSTPKGCSRWI